MRFSSRSHLLIKLDLSLALPILFVQHILLVQKENLFSLLCCAGLLVVLQCKRFSLRLQSCLELREFAPLSFQLRRQRVSLLPLELCFAQQMSFDLL